MGNASGDQGGADSFRVPIRLEDLSNKAQELGDKGARAGRHGTKPGITAQNLGGLATDARNAPCKNGISGAQGKLAVKQATTARPDARAS